MHPHTWGGDTAIASCLGASYGVSVRQVERLALGLDSDAAVFRIDAADGARYFLKLKRGDPPERSVLVPRMLRAAGISQVVAPLDTSTGALWGRIGGASALLYPFVEGRSGRSRGLTTEQWTELGTTIARIHAVEPSPEVMAVLPVEQFVPAPRWIEPLEWVLAGEHRSQSHDELAAPVAAFLDERRAEMRVLLDRTRDLGRELRGQRLERVLCHSDLHLNNVMVDTQERLHLVDWDQPILAPRECDLMLLSGTAFGGFAEGSAEQAAFLAGYGPVSANPVVMAYYYHERVTTDLGSFAHELYWLPDADDETRWAAARWLRVIFEPGRSADAARQAYAKLRA
jgi:spectinomycin phosphotransferase